MKQKKKYVNLRLFFIGFVGMIFGILFFYNLFNLLWLNKLTFWFFFFSLSLIIGIVFTIVCSINKLCRKFLKYVIIFMLLFLVSGITFSVKLNMMNRYKAVPEDSVVAGTVKSHYYKESYYYICLDNVVINSESVDSELSLYVILDSPVKRDLSLGDKIEVKGEVSFTALVTDKINLQRYINNNVYSMNITASSIKLTNQKPNIIQFLHQRLKNVLDDGLTQENSDIAYGVLVGDKEELDEGVSEIFSYAGISHILAVSGLHVGFLVGLITFLLNLFKIGRKKRFFITSIILLLYSAFCSFTPSILRASFMSIILLLSGVVGEEYDGLNSLGFAGILILLLFPEDLFSVGFQLSFMCVFMIITLADKMSRLLKSWKLPEKFASAISVSLCVTIGSSIILANTLGNVSLISIVANLVVIPLFSIIFPMLFLLSLICMIVPIFSGVLVVPQILLHLVKLIANFFANINFAHFRIFNLGYVLLLLFVLLSLIVKFLMVSKTIKVPLCLMLTLVCISMVFIGIKENKYETLAIHTNYQYGTSSTLITTENNKKYLVGIDDYSTLNFLTKLKINKLDTVILQDFEITRIDYYIEFFKNIKTQKLVIPYDEGYYYEMFEKLNKYVEVVSVDNWSDEIDVEFINNEKLVAGVVVDAGEKKILFPHSISKEKLNLISKEVNYVDYVIVNTSKYDFKDFGIEYGKIIHSKKLKFETNNAISLYNNSYFVLELC